MFNMKSEVEDYCLFLVIFFLKGKSTKYFSTSESPCVRSLVLTRGLNNDKVRLRATFKLEMISKESTSFSESHTSK